MKYSIVIPTYNHCNDFLKPCVESIIKYTHLKDIELIVVANGCKDETESYLKYLQSFFSARNLNNNFKYAVELSPLGYAKSTNIGIKLSTTEKIVLLNNDTVLLDQGQNEWLDLLERPFKQNLSCGISCIQKMWSGIVDRNFAVFFCVMIDRKVFNTIGLLSEEYDVGMCEDVDFCFLAENNGFSIDQCTETWKSPTVNSGNFPIYHHGNGTLNDKTLVSNVDSIWYQNCLRIGKKYNTPWYNYITNNSQ